MRMRCLKKCFWSKRDYAKLSDTILAVHWFFEVDGRSVNSCILYLVGLLQALVDRCVLVSSQTHVPFWMKDPTRWLAREKTAR